MSSDASWKEKYLKELEAAETRESRWAEERTALQRMLVRTSLAAQGQSTSLDGHLGKLREEIRKGSSQSPGWGELQDRIDREVASLDEERSQSSKHLSSTLRELMDRLRDQPGFEEQKDSLKRLSKQLKKHDGGYQSLTRWLTEFAEVLEAGLSNGPAPRKRGGVLGRLFGSDPSESEGSGTEAGHDGDSAFSSHDHKVDSTPLPEGAVELADEPAESADERLRIARRVGELLGHMLEQVSLDPAAAARARRLQESLLEGNSWDELRDGLSAVADLVIAAVTRSQQEFEDFLRRLDERLQQLRDHFSEQQSAQEGRLGASEELDREIQRELAAVDEQVAGSSNFDELKASVGHHLKSIRRAVGQFRQQESEREKLLSEQLDAMQERLAATEAQADQMREKLKEERERALTDALTRLPNREAWQDRMAMEFQRWRRYGNPLSVGVIDIDYFKRVNDSYGHKAGDRVLQLVGNAIKERLRETDFVARFGGEEFVLLFPESSVDAAKKALDKLRDHVSSLPFHFRGEPVSVTFSGGVTEFSGEDEPDTVFERADRALYEAKGAGRNRIMVASGNPE